RRAVDTPPDLAPKRRERVARALETLPRARQAFARDVRRAVCARFDGCRKRGYIWQLVAALVPEVQPAEGERNDTCTDRKRDRGSLHDAALRIANPVGPASSPRRARLGQVEGRQQSFD